jgi:hypothetical protein
VLPAFVRQHIIAAYRVLHKEAREMEGKNVSPAVAVIVILIVIVIVLAVGWSIFLKKPKAPAVPEEMSGPGMMEEGMMPDTGAPEEGVVEEGATEEGATEEGEEETEE